MTEKIRLIIDPLSDVITNELKRKLICYQRLKFNESVTNAFVSYSKERFYKAVQL